MKYRAWDKFDSLTISLKATIVFGIASFATSGINYITTPIFTRLLTPEDYGVISVYNSWYSIIQVFATLTLIYPGILQVGLYDHSDNRWKFLSSMLGLDTLATISLGIVLFLFQDVTSQIIKLPTKLIVLMLLMCLFQSATIFWTTKQRYEYNYKLTFWITVGTAILSQIVSVGAVIWAKNDSVFDLALVRLGSAGSVNILVGGILYLYLIYKGRTFIDLDLWKTTLVIALPLIPHYLSSVVLSSTDKIMISNMVGDDKAGIYSLAATLSSIGVLFWRALSTTFSPFINYRLGKRNFQTINVVMKPIIVIVGLTCLLGALCAPEIIKILATDEYLAGIYIIPPVVIGIFLHTLYDMFSAVSFFHKKSQGIMLASLTAATFNVCLNYVCIQRFGYIAAGYTTLISNGILTVMHYWTMRKAEKESIYDIKFIVNVMGIITFCCLLCNLLYAMASGVRYFIVIIVLIVMYNKKHSVIDSLNSMKI